MISSQWIARTARLFSVCFLIVCVLSSTQAQAMLVSDSISNMAQQANNSSRKSMMDQVIDKLKFINNTIQQINYAIEKTHFPLITEAIKKLGSSETEGMKTLSKGRTETAQAQNDATVVATRGEALLRNGTKYTPPTHEQLCRTVKLSQGHKTIEGFEKAVLKMTSEALSNLGRGPKDDFSGALYSLYMERARCTYGFANKLDGYEEVKIVPLGSALMMAPTACKTGAASSLPSKRSFADADLTPTTMDGSMALEMPKMVKDSTGVISGLRPDPDMSNDRQRFWMAGYLFCAHLQGPRITPAWGKNIKTTWGLPQQTIYSTGLARQNQSNNPCLKLLAYHTRPNKDEISDEMKKDQKDLCDKVRGLVPDDELKKRFGDCKEGLSRYQTEYLQHRACKTADFYVQERAAGKQAKQMPDDALLCSQSWTTWLTSLEKRQLALVDAVLGQQQVKEVWPSRHASTFSSNKSYAKASSPKEERSKLHKVKSEAQMTPILPDVIAQ